MDLDQTRDKIKRNRDQARNQINPDVFAAADETDTTEENPFVIDFAEVPSGDVPVPAGTYQVTVTGAKPAISKADNPMIALQLRIDDQGDCYHRIIFDQLVFTQAALWRVRQFLEALGKPATFKGVVEPESLLGEQLTVQTTVRASDKINTETGELYPPKASVKRYLPAGTSQRVADLL